jgi:hypothetical protein
MRWRKPGRQVVSNPEIKLGGMEKTNIVCDLLQSREGDGL